MLVQYASESAGAGNRLAAAKEYAAKQAAARLAPKLAKANTATYLEAMRGHARAFGQKPPKAIIDKAVLAGIASRAQVSATSIVSTQQDRMAALVAQFGSLAAAQAPFRAWEKQQLAGTAQFESSTAVHIALSDLIDRNGLDGTEHLEPQEAAVHDECQDAIDMGEVPLGTLGDPPFHFNCPHWLATSLSQPDDTSGMWFGG